MSALARRQLITAGAAWGLIALFLLLAAGVTFNFVVTQRLIHQSQRDWCDTLTLITSTGPPSRKIPEPTYTRGLTFYRNMKDLERRFGC